MMSRRNSLFVRVLALLLLTALPAPLLPARGGDAAVSKLPTQLFTIRFKDVNDVYLLIEPLLSARGTVQMQPRLRTLAITDDEEALKKIETMILSYDLPPRNVEISLQLILATMAAGAPDRISPRIRGVIEKLNEVTTRWSDYRLLSSTTLTSSEGDKASVQMGEDYLISFAVDYASEEQKLIRFKRFTLDRREKPRNVELGGETYARVLDTALNLRADKLHILGFSKLESSNRALFLTVKASMQR